MKKIPYPLLLLPLSMASCFNRSVPDPSRCDCPATFLFHEQSSTVNTDKKILIKMPSGKHIWLLSEKNPETDISLKSRELEIESTSSNQVTTKVYPSTVYEEINSRLPILCMQWAALCETGFMQEDVKKWHESLYHLIELNLNEEEYSLPVKESGAVTLPPDTPQTVSMAKNLSKVSISYLWPHSDHARLQLLVNYKRNGAWLRFHRDDYFLTLEKGHNSYTITLQEIGFTTIPMEWDYSLILHHKGHQKILRPFSEG